MKPNSHRILRLGVTKHIVPSVGEYRLKDLRNDMVQKMVNELSDKGYAPETIKKAHSALHAGLEKGIELKVMQELLGHSSIKMTADIYECVK